MVNILSKFSRDAKVVVEVLLPGSEKVTGDIVVVADASGSMAGSRQRWVEDLAVHLFKSVDRVHWFSFSGKVRDFGEVTTIPPGWFISGQTDFYLPLNEVHKLKLKKGSTVFFLTDGEENCNSQLRASLLRETRLPHAKVEVIGVSRSSDTQVLFDISRWGESEGSYVSLNSGEDLVKVRETMKNSVVGENVEVFGKTFRLTREPRTVFVELNSWEITKELSAQLVDVPEGTIANTHRYLLQLIEEAIKSKNVPRMRELSKSLGESFSDVSRTVRSLPRPERKAFLRSYTTIAQLIAQIDREAVGGRLSNEAYARLYTAASQARKPRINHIVDSRAAANMDVFKDQDVRMKEVAASLKLGVEEQKELSDYVCLLTMDSADEAITDVETPDALGIGVSFKSNPNAAVDPSLCSVTGISTSYFCCNNFLTHANDAGLMVYSPAEKKVVDASRMGVNAVLPLYLSENHWKVAVLLIRRMTGHAVAGDPCASTNSIVVHAYLKLLGYAHKTFQEAKTEHNKKIYGLVKKTVEKLLVIPHYRDILPSLEQFLSSPSQRTKAAVPDMTAYQRFLMMTVPVFTTHQKLLYGAYLLERQIRYNRLNHSLIWPSSINDTIDGWLSERTVKLDPVEYGQGKYNDIQLTVENVFPPLPPFPEWEVENYPRVSLGPPGKTPVFSGGSELEKEFEEYNRTNRFALWLTFKQALHYTGVEFEEKYVDYLKMSEEEARRTMDNILRTFYETQARHKALSLINSCVSAGAEEALKRLSPELSLEDFTYLATCYCRMGVNNILFARAANTIEKIRVVMTGRDVEGNLVIPNMKSCKHTHVYRRPGSGVRTRVDYEGMWIPKRRFLRTVHKGCEFSWLYLLMKNGSPTDRYNPHLELYDWEDPQDLQNLTRYKE